MTNQSIEHVEHNFTFKKECMSLSTYHIPQNVNRGCFSGRIMDSFYFLICDYLYILYIL